MSDPEYFKQLLDQLHRHRAVLCEAHGLEGLSLRALEEYKDGRDRRCLYDNQNKFQWYLLTDAERDQELKDQEAYISENGGDFSNEDFTRTDKGWWILGVGL